MTIRKDTWYPDLEGLYQTNQGKLRIKFAEMQKNLSFVIWRFFEDLNDLERQGVILTPEIVVGLPSYIRMINAIQEEVHTFSVYAGAEVDILLTQTASLGEKAALDLVLSNLGTVSAEAVVTSWSRPSQDALARFMAYINDSAMQAEFRRYGVQVAERFSEMLIGGIGTGTNPSQLALKASRLLNLPFVWADNISRTTSLYSYRMAAHATYYENSDLLEGWYWISALDDRTCMSCIDNHGQLFPVDQVLNDHHRGRCVPVPAVIGSNVSDNIVMGRDWFESQPENRQRLIMGDPLYSAYKAGRINWGQFSEEYHNPTFGDMLTETTVIGLLGAEGVNFY